MTVRLEGYVGGPNFNASVFNYQLSMEPKDGPIDIEITSEGGSYLEALKLVNIITNLGRKTKCRIGAYAVSAGSYVAMACSETEVAANAILMYHKPEHMGDREPRGAEDLRGIADILDKMAVSYVALMAAKSGKSAEEVSKLLEDELYCTPQEALKLGLVDRVVPVVVNQRRLKVTNFKLPERIVAFVTKENDRMALKDVLGQFKLQAEEGKEEDTIVNFIKELQVKASAEPIRKEKTSIPATVVNLVVKNRNLELDDLVNKGKLSVASKNELAKVYTDAKHLQESFDDNGELTDEFDKVVNALLKNEEVLSYSGRSGVQQLGNSNNPGNQEANLLVAEMESRTKKG